MVHVHSDNDGGCLLQHTSLHLPLSALTANAATVTPLKE